MYSVIRDLRIWLDYSVDGGRRSRGDVAIGRFVLLCKLKDQGIGLAQRLPPQYVAVAWVVHAVTFVASTVRSARRVASTA